MLVVDGVGAEVIDGATAFVVAAIGAEVIDGATALVVATIGAEVIDAALVVAAIGAEVIDGATALVVAAIGAAVVVSVKITNCAVQPLKPSSAPKQQVERIGSIVSIIYKVCPFRTGLSIVDVTTIDTSAVHAQFTALHTEVSTASLLAIHRYERFSSDEQSKTPTNSIV